MRTTRLSRVLSSLMLVFLLPSLSLAQPAPGRSDKQIWAGVAALGVGVTFTALAFNYSDHCGYTDTGTMVDLGSGIPKQCVFTGRNSVSVTDVRTEADLARPWMLWTGLGAIGVGIIVLAVPPKVRGYSPEIAFSSKGVTATKTIRW